MNIINLKIKDLKPYTKNAKTHPVENIEAIKKSIQKYGFADPIAVWGKKNIIVEGHGRYLACKELGIEEVPCIRLDHLTDKERREYTLLHSKTTMMSDFDFDLLNQELVDLDLSDFNIDWEIPELDELKYFDDNEEENEKNDDIVYFENEEIKKDVIDNWRNYNFDEFIANIIDIPTAKYQFNRLCQGYKDGYNISLLFNPHRLDTPAYRSKSIFESFNNSDVFKRNYARYMVDVGNKVILPTQYYKNFGIGIGGIQYINEFQPYLARDIYKKYCKNGDKILNQCAGWGGRLIGLASCLFDDIEYVETDPSTPTFNGLTKLKKFLKLGDNYKQYNLPFEDLELQENYFDFAFTSPPYFDTEHYTNEKTQSFLRNKNYETWKVNFLYVLIDKTLKSLKIGGKCILNVGNKRYPLTEDILTYLKTKYNIEGQILDYRLDSDSDDAMRSSKEDFILFEKKE